MTCIVYDGTTLAADSMLFAGSNDPSLKVDPKFNKIWFVNDFVFSACGNESAYFHLERQLKKISDYDQILELELDNESEAIIFWKHSPKQYFTHDGMHVIINKINQKTAAGATEDYAFALLHSGMNAVDIVKQCIKYHTGAGGKPISINIKEYFQW